MPQNNKTFNFWNKSNKYYDAAKSEMKPLSANPALKRLFNNIKSGNSVLDVGCGEGSKIIDAFKRINNISAYGIDVSDVAIRRAKNQNSKINFRCGNIEKLPYKSDKFDITFSTYVFEHTTKPMKILKEMIRVTKIGGKIIIVCPNYGSPIYTSPITPKLKHMKKAFLRELKYLFKKPKSLE